MKTIFYSLMVIMLSTSATCKKVRPGDPLNKQLIGMWKYTGKSGGYAGKSEKADAEIIQVLEFKSGFRYIQKTNNQVSGQGTYELYKVKSIYSGKEDNAIRFSSTSAHPNKDSIISLNNDTLVIADNVYDGFKMKYIRFTP
ncbi:hypothetical protein D3C86_1388320 [compost metagenome]